MGLDLIGGQSLRSQRDHHLVDAGQALLPLLDDLRFEGAVPVAGHGYLHKPYLGQHGLAAFAVGTAPQGSLKWDMPKVKQLVSHIQNDEKVTVTEK